MATDRVRKIKGLPFLSYCHCHSLLAVDAHFPRLALCLDFTEERIQEGLVDGGNEFLYTECSFLQINLFLPVFAV